MVSIEFHGIGCQGTSPIYFCHLAVGCDNFPEVVERGHDLHFLPTDESCKVGGGAGVITFYVHHFGFFNLLGFSWFISRDFCSCSGKCEWYVVICTRPEEEGPWSRAKLAVQGCSKVQEPGGCLPVIENREMSTEGMHKPAARPSGIGVGVLRRMEMPFPLPGNQFFSSLAGR